jgi:hypothetical protein
MVCARHRKDFVRPILRDPTAHIIATDFVAKSFVAKSGAASKYDHGQQAHSHKSYLTDLLAFEAQVSSEVMNGSAWKLVRFENFSAAKLIRFENFSGSRG